MQSRPEQSAQLSAAMMTVQFRRLRGTRMDAGIDAYDSAEARWLRRVAYLLVANMGMVLALSVALQWR